MWYIYYLKLTQAGMLLKPHLHNHFVFSFNKTSFFVLSSNPVQGLKSHFIHNFNIRGFQRSQYLIEKLHSFDPKLHILEYTEKGAQYLIDHHEKFQTVLEMIKNLPQ